MTQKRPQQDHDVSADEMDTYDSDFFSQIGISRRQFVAAALATGGSLTFSGQAAADHTSEKTTDLYEFIQRHTAEQDPAYKIKTLIHLSDASGQDELDELIETWNKEDEDSIEVFHTTEPEVASYAQLTRYQSQDVIELDAVDMLEFSPGANPFWKLGDYNETIFPPVDDSVHYIGYNEMISGMEHLANEHSDRFKFYSVGKSAGYHNLLNGDDDRKDMWVAELTNNVNDEESFREKSKSVYTLSIHGDERAGVETGCRMIETILRDDTPEIDKHLDDVVILCAFLNPDGWIARQPQYMGVINNFKRENGAGFDLNRSYPSAGLIQPSHYPADPNGQNLQDDQLGRVDNDIPDRTVEHSPETLAIIEWLRGYENHEALVDLHGKGLSNEFMYSLSPTSRQFDHIEQHDTQEMMRQIGVSLFDELGPVEDHLDSIALGFDRYNLDPDDSEDRKNLPNTLYNYGTIVDTLGYLATGEARSWFAALEEFGGFETKAITPETTLSNKISGVIQEYTPPLLDLQVRGYEATMRATIAYSASSIDADIDNDGRNTAVIHTNALTRSSDDLVFADTEKAHVTETVRIGPTETKTVTIEVPEKADEIHVNFAHKQDIHTTLQNPNDTQTNEYDSVDENGRGAEWSVTDPAVGEWTVRIEHRDADDEEIEVTADIDTLITDEGADTPDEMVITPDPVEVLGYEQREYEATPFQYFEDYSDYIASNKASLDFVSVEEVRDGALTENEGSLTYENVILIHDDGISKIANSLDTFVEAGGNLVLTDTGVFALTEMNAVGADDISNTDVDAIERQFAVLDPAPSDPDADEKAAELPSRDLDHPLLANTDEFNQSLFGISSIGHMEDEAPLTLINPDVFTGAGGRIAARTDDKVSVGTLGTHPDETDGEDGGIQVIGGLVPPPNQHRLHPFGLLDYGVEFLGHTIMTNALGYKQHRYINGELTESWTQETDHTDDTKYYQIDFVTGEPIEQLDWPDGSYTNDQLIRFAHGSTEEAITRHSEGEFTTNSDLAERIDSQQIGVDGNTASITFTVADGESVTLSLVSYTKPDPTWDPEDEDDQTFVDAQTETYDSGTHTLTVDLPTKTATS